MKKIVIHIWLGVSAPAFAQSPQLINIQGLLNDPSTGQPVPDNFYQMVFSIYNAATGGTAVWSESQSVLTQSGLYSAALGSVTPLTAAVFAGPETYLGIKVGNDAEMVPRKRIGSVANAMVSAEADKLDGKDADEFLQDIIAGNAITIGNGSMATNATGPSATIAVAPNSINDDEIEDNSLTANSLAPNSVGTSEIADNAVTIDKITTNLLRSIDGVSNDGGNVDLVEGANITITPNDATNSITISASAGGSGGGVEQVNSGKNIVVTDPAGPTATVSLRDIVTLGPNAITGLIINDLLDNNVVTLKSVVPEQSQLDFRNAKGLTAHIFSNALGGNFEIWNPGIGDVVEMRQSSGGGGLISVSNASSNLRASLGVNTVDGGNIEIFGPGGIKAANLASAGSFGGTLDLFNDSGQRAALLSTAGGGFLSTYNSDGKNVVLITENNTKAGFVGINSPNEIPLAYLSNNTAGGGFLGINSSIEKQAARITAGNNGGTISINSIQGNAVNEAATVALNTAGGGYAGVNNANATPVAIITENLNGGGFLASYAADGSEVIRLSTNGTGANEEGILTVNSSTGQPAVLLGLNSATDGSMLTLAADGSRAVLVTTSADAGYVQVNNATGSATITLQGSNGVVFANQVVQSSPNNSRMAHPLQHNKEIYYGSLEGPEAAVYVRGTAQLLKGQARIRLPDHFSLVANGEDMTVQLTPRSASSEGLAVVKRSTREIVVRELRNGSGSYEFDYLAHTVRQGYETFQVVRDKVEMSPHTITALPDVAAAAVPAEATTISSTPRVAQAVVDALAAPPPRSDKSRDRRQDARNRK